MQERNTMNCSGVRILTISPGAWPCAATPLRRRRRWWSSPEEGSSPSWTLRPPQLGRPSFSSLPPLEGERSLLPPPRLHGRSAPWSRRMMNLTPPGARHSFESPWPSSWPSSLAPHKAPEPASPLGEHLLDLRAGGLDNRSAPLSLPSPVKWRGGLDPAHGYIGEKNILQDIKDLPDWQGALR